MSEKCWACNSRATHLAKNEAWEDVNSCNECCGGCIGLMDCDYQE